MSKQPGNIPTKDPKDYTQAQADADNAKAAPGKFQEDWNKRRDDGTYVRDLVAEIAAAKASPKYASNPAAAEARIAEMQKALDMRNPA